MSAGAGELTEAVAAGQEQRRRRDSKGVAAFREGSVCDNRQHPLLCPELQSRCPRRHSAGAVLGARHADPATAFVARTLRSLSGRGRS